MMILINIAILNRTSAVLSSFSNGIASSYFKVTKSPKIDTIDRYAENIPKSLGEYNLAKIGLIKIGIAWAIAVPVNKVKTLRENLDFK